MADTTRILAIFQIIFGLLLLGISFADLVVYFVPFLIYNILGSVLGMWVSKNTALAGCVKQRLWTIK